nr:reverse transcriptase domain-containing protein [Tanacetum cinerariifolium]
MVEKETRQNTPFVDEKPKEVSLMEEMFINPSYPKQLVTVGGNLFEGCKSQIKALLKKNMGVFVWEPSDMIRVPRRIIEHVLNVNPLIEPFCQKQRVLAPDRSQVVIKEVEEWLKTDPVGFAEDMVKPLGKIELKVVFGVEGLFRRVIMNFTIIRTSSPYNNILERTGSKTL